jgi:hypothetical protein
MPFIPLFSVVTPHDPYFHEITLPINAGHDKLFFVLDKPNIFAISVLED